MGGMVDCGVTLDSKNSPRRAAIEKAQEELRLEYDVREERRRELEFLEKGGNPLDFKFGNVASLSVQSTSLNVTSEAKGSFSLAPSPHGDSVESSGPNMADNLLLLDGDNSNPVSGPEKSSNMQSRNGNGNNTKEQEEPGILRFARRNRSRPANNAVRLAPVPSKDATKPSMNEASKTLQPEEEKEREKDNIRKPASPVSNSKPDSPRKSELTLRIVQPEEVAADREAGLAGPAPMDVDARVEEVETRPIEAPVEEKPEAPIASVENENEVDTDRELGPTQMDVDVRNVSDGSRCNDEIPASSTGVLTDDKADSKEVPACNSTADNGLIENGDSDAAATATHAAELDSNVVQLDETDLVAVQIKDEKEEEEIKLEKLSVDETTAPATVEVESNKEDTCMAEPVLDTVAVVRLPPVSEIAAAAPTAEEAAKVAKEHEDEILEKARIIEANLKRAGEMPSSRLTLEKRRKSHWDFVLEEMAWMANDFMQEHLWKIAAASQVCKWIKNGGLAKFEEVNLCRRQKNTARTMAKAVMSFWHSVDAERKQVKSCMKEDSNSRQARIKAYALRVLDYNSGLLAGPVLAEAPTTPERPSDKGALLLLEQLPEERLFYTVPPGAMQSYRESIESQFAQHKKTGMATYHDECETSNSVADISRENAYEEDEVQTGSYSYEGGFSPRLSKKRKHPIASHQKAYAPRVREHGAQSVLPEPYIETKHTTQNQALSNGKRPLHSPNIVIIPAKKVRTQVPGRKAGPHFSTGMAAGLHSGIKMDASSDTNSYQEERASLQHCDSFGKRNIEVESPVARGPSYDEVAARSKKKKAKYSDPLYGPGKNSLFEHRSHGEASFQHDQKDHFKSRTESHQIDNGNNVAYGQHGSRRLKISPSRQEGVGLTGGAMTSTGPPHTVSNSKQLIKIINSGRDRGVTIRKGKGAKLAANHSGPGSPWSSFEDQTLVVLVHDLGPNWELISDAINNTLLFKHCIYKRAQECKERHRFLMEQKTIDGADSAEDSGSSQTGFPRHQLPGIPKGTARELFQKLQGPLEEDTLKSHFGKIISLSQKLRPRKNQELKQMTPPHNSHAAALSQVCPNNLGGTVLTPLDLSDAPSPSPEIPQLGYSGPHANGLPLPGHQGSIGAPMLPPTSNMGTVMQGSPALVLPGSLSSPSSMLSTPTREPQRYGMPRGAVLQPDEQQQRMQQQYNQMVSGRSLPQPGMPLSGPLPPSAVDRGGPVRMLPPGAGSGGMSMMPSGSGLTRGMPPVPRPGFQRLNSPAMLNMVPPSGNMLPASGPGLQGPMNPMLRPRDSLQLLKQGQNVDEHSRQMRMQEMQVQQQMPSQGNNNGGVQFSAGPTSSISTNSTASPPVQSFPAVQSHGPQPPHQQIFPNHATPQQQAYAIHFAKERQMQQKQQQQRLMSPAQQPPIMASESSPGPGVGPGPACQSQQQQKNLPEGSGLKKPKQNAQQRQNNQSAKGSKGRGGGSILMHQTLAGTGSAGLNPSLPQQTGNQPSKLYPSSMAPLGGTSRLGPPLHAVDPSNTNQMPSDSSNTNQQEGISGNEMLIGPAPVSGSVSRPPGIGGAHWQPKNQVQSNNNNNRSVVQGGSVYGQPSNSGPG